MSQPAQPPPPFPPPVLLPAKRVIGIVQPLPEHSAAAKRPPAVAAAAAAATTTTDGQQQQQKEKQQDDEAPVTPTLTRVASIMDGNILVVEQDREGTRTTGGGRAQAYLLQRKIRNTLYGSVRIGFALKDPHENADGVWEIAPGDGPYHCDMVAVKVENKSTAIHHHAEPPQPQNAVFNHSDDHNNGGSSDHQKRQHDHHHHRNTVFDPMTELSVLQLIAAHDPAGVGHVVGSATIAVDHCNIYVVTPYHDSGTLFDYCCEADHGRLQEHEARFFFRQILQGLATLQQVEICLRSLSLESVLLRGTRCDLSKLGTALRIPVSADAASDGGGGSSGGGGGVRYLIEPQPACGTDPQYLAPEIMNNEPFDGYAADLWSAAVILFFMLLGVDGRLLFAAPVPADRAFKQICVRANLAGAIRRWNDKQQQQQQQAAAAAAAAAAATTAASASTPPAAGAAVSISDDAVDLLQRMLRAEPRDRLSLEQVQQHAWVKKRGSSSSASDEAAAAAAADNNSMLCDDDDATTVPANLVQRQRRRKNEVLLAASSMCDR